MHMSQQLIAQIESLAVDFVRDLRMGLRANSAQYIRMADLAVARRCWLRGDSVELGEWYGERMPCLAKLGVVFNEYN